METVLFNLKCHKLLKKRGGPFFPLNNELTVVNMIQFSRFI